MKSVPDIASMTADDIKAISAALFYPVRGTALDPNVLAKAPDCSNRVEESKVFDLIKADSGRSDPSTTVYVSAHKIFNRMLTAAPRDKEARASDLLLCRYGLSKVLNSTTRVVPRIIHPTPIDSCNLVFKVDLSQYWPATIKKTGQGFPPTWTITADPQRAKDVRTMILTSLASANEQRMHFSQTSFTYYKDMNLLNEKVGIVTSPDKTATYSECSQFIHALTRPPMYHYLQETPQYIQNLQTQYSFSFADYIGAKAKNLDLIFYTESRHAITFSDRLGYCKELNWETTFAKNLDFGAGPRPFLYFCRTTESDLANQTPYGLYINPEVKWRENALLNPRHELYPGFDTREDPLAGETIFTLPNGLQGYMLDFNSGMRRSMASAGVVADPLLAAYDVHAMLQNGIGCIACHTFGLNRAKNDMLAFLQDPTKVDTELNFLPFESRAAYLPFWGPESKHEEFYAKSDQQFRRILLAMFEAMNPGLSEGQKLRYFGREPIARMMLLANETYGYSVPSNLNLTNFFPFDDPGGSKMRNLRQTLDRSRCLRAPAVLCALCQGSSNEG